MIEVKDVVKTFDGFRALDGVTMTVPRGAVYGLVGPNGAGKSTLIRHLTGIYRPDSGAIDIDGQPVYENPAVKARIAYIPDDVFYFPQATIPDMMRYYRGIYPKFDAERYQKLGDVFRLDPKRQIRRLSKGMQKQAAFWLAMSLRPDVLILDEPTAVLTPQETDKLFAIMRNMKADGKSLIIITHKLHEVLDVSDRVAVLRKGEYVGDVATKDADQQSLTDMMVGHTVSLNISRPEPKDVEKRLVIEGLTAYDELGVKRLDDVSFTINAGEVLGIAGVAGSGQRELLESIAGLYPVASGHVTFYPPDGGKEKELVGLDPMKIRKSGISMSFVPEDRLGMGLVGSMGMTGNMMLRSWRKGKGLFLNRKDPEALANRIWEELGVVTPSTSFPVRRMSGGNVQKVLVGREIAQSPAVLMTAYAVRGLDINTSYTIYNLLTEQKMKGVAVVYVGEDLDVLLELCDRIVVLCGGQVSGVVDARKTDKREVGALMTLVRGGNKDE